MTVANLRPTVEDFKKEALLKPEVKKEYERLKVEFDFTNAEQGKFYRPIEEFGDSSSFRRRCKNKLI